MFTIELNIIRGRIGINTKYQCHFLCEQAVREGVKKNSPPPSVVPRTIYILGPFFWDTESMIAKTNFTLGPIKKSLCFVLL